MSAQSSLAVLAGEGDFPIILTQKLKSQKIPFILFYIQDISSPKLLELAQESYAIPYGALDHFVGLLKKCAVKKMLLSGGIPKSHAYQSPKSMDNAAQGFLANLKNRGDDHILRAFEWYLNIRCGIKVLDCRQYLKEDLAERGMLSNGSLTDLERGDVRFGVEMARKLGSLDIGQTLAVKNRTIVAVEAMEGTAQTIARSGVVGGQGVVIVKASKTNQSLKYDLPCVGPRTLEQMHEARCRVLAIESGKTILLYKSKMIEYAGQYGIDIVGF